MRFLPPMNRLLSRNGGPAFAAALVGSLMWILHFVLEFSLLDKWMLEPHYILFHLTAVALGALMYVAWSSKHRVYPTLVVCMLLQGVIMSILCAMRFDLLSVVSELYSMTAALLLTSSGLVNGLLVSYTFVMSYHVLDNVQFNGRTCFLAYSILSTVVIAAGIFDLNSLPILFMALIALVVATVIIGATIGRPVLEAVPLRSTTIGPYLRGAHTYPALLFAFFVGFFFTNTYYAVGLLLGQRFGPVYIPSLDYFVVVLFLTCLIMALPSGLFLDTRGRRFSVLLGFYMQAFAFLLLAFLPLEDVMVFIFPVVVGLGFSLSILGGMLYMYELAPSGSLRVHIGLSFALFSIGMTVGVVTDTALVSVIENTAYLLPVVLIFALFTATIVVLQLPESLPPREELEWRNDVEHILVVSKGGLPLYSERLCRDPLKAQSPDDMLVSGALSGISQLVREISQNATKLKVIQQESYSILLEEGRDVIVAVMARHDLNAIRNRMQDFLEEFQVFFGQLVLEWEGETKVFSPTRGLVAKHFG